MSLHLTGAAWIVVCLSVLHAPAADVEELPKAPSAEVRYKGKPTSYWISQLGSAKAEVRRTGVIALAVIGPEAAPAVPRLIKLLDDEDVGVRAGALEALGQIGPDASIALPALLEAAEDKDPRFRRSAIVAVSKLGTVNDQVIAVIVRELHNRDSSSWGSEGTQRQMALLALERLGPDALKLALPDLKRTLWDWSETDASAKERRILNPNWPARVMESLMLVGADAVPILTEMVETTDVPRTFFWSYHNDFRRQAVNALGVLGPRAQAATPILKQAVVDADPKVRAAATRALAKITVKEKTTSQP